jgi:hypothetical protein
MYFISLFNSFSYNINNLKYNIKNKSKNKQNKRISDNSITKIKTNCTAIVIFNTKSIYYNYGTIGIRLNKINREMTVLIPSLREQIIGHMLGDACIVYSHTSKIPYFQFVQSLKKFHYLLFSFNFLASLCESIPKLNISFRKEKKMFSLSFRTRSYPFLISIHNLFYKKINGK